MIFDLERQMNKQDGGGCVYMERIHSEGFPYMPMLCLFMDAIGTVKDAAHQNQKGVNRAVLIF